jgi:hypothetical protein
VLEVTASLQYFAVILPHSDPLLTVVDGILLLSECTFITGNADSSVPAVSALLTFFNALLTNYIYIYIYIDI